MSAFGDQLRRHRQAAGLTQEELAAHAGVSVRAVADMERGRTARPYRRSVMLLAEALELSATDAAQFLRSSRPSPSSKGPGGEQGPTAEDQLLAPTARVTPRQMPAAAGHFVGRAAELAMLDALLGDATSRQRTVVISAIGGSPGVGKTALALQWAHQAASRFPDGQLYVNLRGFGPSEAPMRPAESVRLFLDALGIARDRLPVDLDAQAALYRSLLADKRMLIVLDNARDPAQVRPLLPGSPTCLVLVTSRNQLTGLAVADGASLLALDVLTEPEARHMLALRLGPGRVAAEPEAVTELIDLCARLPLALSIAAARAAARLARPLAALVTELHDAHTRLDALGTGDAASDLRTVLSWSIQQLSSPTARMFRLLSAHPGPDITVPAAASLAAVSLPRARQAIDDLVRAHLITEHLPGRYAFHDLLRAYSTERACLDDSDSDRHAARHRVLDHYLHTTFAASLALCFRDPVPLSPLQPGVLPEEVTDRQHALGWFQAERLVLLAAITLACESGFGVHSWQLPWTMATFLDQLGYWHELVATQQVALTAATQLRDHAGQAEAHRHLARGQIRLGEHAAAITHLTAVIELGTQTGDDLRQAMAHHDLGGVLESQGHIRDALAHAEQAQRLYRRAGHRWGEAVALSAVGWSHSQLGNYRDALEYCRQAMASMRELQIKLGQSSTLDTLGYVHHQLGQYRQAIACFQEAIGIDGDTGDRRVRAEILIHLGDAEQAAGNQDPARHAWLQALAILEELNQPDTDRVRSRLSQQPATGVAAGTTGLTSGNDGLEVSGGVPGPARRLVGH